MATDFACDVSVAHEYHAPLLRMQQGFVNEVAFELVCGDGGIMPVLVNARQRRAATRQAQGGTDRERQGGPSGNAEPRHPQHAERATRG